MTNALTDAHWVDGDRCPLENPFESGKMAVNLSHLHARIRG